jgi:hypothetical protein
MRLPALTAAFLLVAALVAPSALEAQTVRATSSDSISRIVPRMQSAEADFSIVSTDGGKTILQRGDVVVFQLTDRGLGGILRETREREAEQSGFARLVSGMVRGGLRVLLDNAIEYEISALSEVRHENGALVFLDRGGKRVFDQMMVDGEEFMESFSHRDAEALARRLNGMIARRATR